MVSIALVAGTCLAVVLVVMFIVAGLFMKRKLLSVLSGFREVSLWPSTFTPSFDMIPDDPDQGVDEPQKLAKLARWNGEALISLAIPWATLAIGLCVSKLLHTKIPAVLALLVLPQIVRVKAWELHDIRLVRKQALGMMDMIRGLQSCMEVLDAATDGLAVASCMSLTDLTYLRFQESWRDAVWPYGMLIAQMGPGFSTAAALAYSTWVQVGAVCFSGGTDALLKIQVQADTATDMAGAGALTAVLQEDRGKYKEEAMYAHKQLTTGARAVAEAALQLLLQTSVIAAKNQGFLSDTILAASVSMSWLTLFFKWVSVLGGYRFLIFVLGMKDDYKLAWLLYVCVVPSLGALLVYVAAKVYFIETCASHEWGMSTGCQNVSG